jgi:hypothetical protein
MVQMQTLEQFLSGSAVSMRCREVPLNGDGGLAVGEPWAAKHYSCELYGTNGDRPVRALVGSDIGPPGIDEVLDAVAAEAAVAEEAGGFEAWAAQLGYDPDSRYDERIYRTALRHARLLRRMLGDEGYRRLLWETERL